MTLFLLKRGYSFCIKFGKVPFFLLEYLQDNFTECQMRFSSFLVEHYREFYITMFTWPWQAKKEKEYPQSASSRRPCCWLKSDCETHRTLGRRYGQCLLLANSSGHFQLQHGSLHQRTESLKTWGKIWFWPQHYLMLCDFWICREAWFYLSPALYLLVAFNYRNNYKLRNLWSN